MASALRLRAAVGALLLLLSSALLGLFVGGVARGRLWGNGSARAAAQGAPHLLLGGFWRTDGGFVSTIRIEDVLVATPMDVTPTLYMADGTPYALPPVHIPAGGVTTIDVNSALAAAPPAIAAHVSKFGNVSLQYNFPDGGHVYASSVNLDVARSLIFTNPFLEMPGAGTQATPPPQPSGQVLEGLWWKHDAGVSGFLTLFNATGSPVAATLRLVGSDTGGSGPSFGVDLAPYETRMIPLDQIGDESAQSAAGQATAGGIRVEYEGMMGDVIVGGGLMNPREGYSAGIPFWSHDPTGGQPAQISYASAGIMVGVPDPMMMPGFPPRTSFTPYLILRNTTPEAVGAFLGANYMASSGASASVQLPEQFLGPFETRAVDLPALLAGAGLANFSGLLNIETQFTGNPGDLLVATGSVDQTGNYVFAVAPQGIDKTTSKIGSYWTDANGNDTMFSLWNPTEQAEDIAVSFRYGDGSGSYNLPVHLDAQGSAMLDIGMLKMEGTLDSSGQPFSASVTQGSVSFENAQPGQWMQLVAAGGTFNTMTATCGQTCIQCCGWNYNTFYLSPSSATVGVGGNQSFELRGTNCSAPGQAVPVVSWVSYDSSIASVNGSGNVTGVAPGSTTIEADTSVYNDGARSFQYCVEYGNPTCPTGPGDAVDATVNVTPDPTVTFSSTPGIPAGGSGGITATVSPANNTMQIALALSTTSGSGSATFSGSNQSPQITATTTLTIDGGTPSSTPNNIRLSATVTTQSGQMNVGSTTFSVVAIPTNWTQTSESNLPDGTLYFTYTWSSSDGTLGDLSACSAGESVFYPNYPDASYTWPLPMVQTSVNPTVLSGSGSVGEAQDNNYPPDSYQTPYGSAGFSTTQRFWWSCPNYDNDGTEPFAADVTITRSVFKDADGFWKYKITKSGYTNIVKLPNQ